MISSSVKFLLNDKLIVINNPDPNQTILNYIRTELKKTGTKEGCSEGGCGACTIVLGELVDNKIIYKAINSCISFVPSLNGKQLLIVEDLVSKDGKLHPVQDAMVKFHGSQCGFCTPGFVMALFSMFKNNKNLNNELITDSISGNLCRCTGYRPIIDAAKRASFVKYVDGRSIPINILGSPKIEDSCIISVGKKEEVEPFSITEYITNLTSIYADLTQALLLVNLARQN